MVRSVFVGWLKVRILVVVFGELESVVLVRSVVVGWLNVRSKINGKV